MPAHNRERLLKRFEELTKKHYTTFEAVNVYTQKETVKKMVSATIPVITRGLLEEAPAGAAERLHYLEDVDFLLKNRFGLDGLTETRWPKLPKGGAVHGLSGTQVIAREQRIKIKAFKKALKLAVTKEVDEMLAGEMLRLRKQLKPQKPKVQIQTAEEKAAEPVAISGKQKAAMEKGFAEMQKRLKLYDAGIEKTVDNISEAKSRLRAKIEAAKENSELRALFRKEFPGRSVSDILERPPERLEFLASKSERLRKELSPVFSAQSELSALERVRKAYQEDIGNIRQKLREAGKN
jgi:hypothetical protein